MESNQPRPLSVSAMEAFEHILRHSSPQLGASTVRLALEALQSYEASTAQVATNHQPTLR